MLAPPGCLAAWLFAPHDPTRQHQISGFPRPQLSWSFVMTIDKRGSCWSLFKIQTARLGWVVSGFESATSKVELILESRLYDFMIIIDPWCFRRSSTTD
jgi:hypothetical protein